MIRTRTVAALCALSLILVLSAAPAAAPAARVPSEARGHGRVLEAFLRQKLAVGRCSRWRPLTLH